MATIIYKDENEKKYTESVPFSNIQLGSMYVTLPNESHTGVRLIPNHRVLKIEIPNEERDGGNSQISVNVH